MAELSEIYLQGLTQLRREMKEMGEDYPLVDSLHMRLKENIEAKKRNGDTKDMSAARIEILQTANDITDKLFDMSFDDYCKSKSQLSESLTIIDQETDISITKSSINSSEQITETFLSDNQPEKVQQVLDFLAKFESYLVELQVNIQKARSIFTEDRSTNIDRGKCREALSAFSIFDCTNLPVYNQSLYRAKTRLQHLRDEVNRLIGMHGFCNDYDRNGRINGKKLQDLIGLLDSLYSEITSVQKLLRNIDTNISD